MVKQSLLVSGVISFNMVVVIFLYKIIIQQIKKYYKYSAKV